MLRRNPQQPLGNREGGLYPTIREPGDLPIVRGNGARNSEIFLPLARTEVVMAARTENTISLPLASRLTTAVFSLMLGVFLVYGVGLANSDTLHDTAHDTRHSYGFPCH